MDKEREENNKKKAAVKLKFRAINLEQFVAFHEVVKWSEIKTYVSILLKQRFMVIGGKMPHLSFYF